MDADTIFQFACILAFVGWGSLLISPLTPNFPTAWRLSGCPLLLALAYTGLVLAFWSNAEGGFDSLDNVALLFETREILLAGWIHYLAFDLFIGAWIVRAARQAGIAFWVVVPCLALTFLFGPAGLLAFLAIRAVKAPSSALATA